MLASEKRFICSKQLILHNLQELYFQSKAKDPKEKTGFSMFASLQPKWSTIAGASKFICNYHQNVKFMLGVENLDKTYHYFIDMIACDRNMDICMIHFCKFGYVISNVEKHLKENFQLTDEPESVCSNEDENRTRNFEEEKEGNHHLQTMDFN